MCTSTTLGCVMRSEVRAWVSTYAETALIALCRELMRFVDIEELWRDELLSLGA